MWAIGRVSTARTETNRVVDPDMGAATPHHEETAMTVDAATHRRLAIEANNSTWEILGEAPSTIEPAAAEEMTRRAYAAAYHWSRAEGSSITNEARADWLLAKVWIARGNADVALHHASRCLAACERGALADFDLAYAHEVMGRAHAALGHRSLAVQHRDLARAVAIADADDREQVIRDLAAEPWFGI